MFYDPSIVNKLLRPEAVSMLCDLAARRLTPDAVDSSRSPCLSPRKFRKLTKDNNHYELPNGKLLLDDKLVELGVYIGCEIAHPSPIDEIVLITKTFFV